MDKLRLVPADPALAATLLTWRQDEDTKRYNPLAPHDVEDLRAMLASASSDFAKFATEEVFYWFAARGDEIVANVNLRGINRMMLTAEIGYGVAPAARSHGVATEAVRLLTEKAFRETPLRKLYAYVHEQNIASRKVLEKLGYRQEGLLRDHYLVNGKPVNEAFYGLLREEF